MKLKFFLIPLFLVQTLFGQEESAPKAPDEISAPSNAAIPAKQASKPLERASENPATNTSPQKKPAPPENEKVAPSQMANKTAYSALIPWLVALVMSAVAGAALFYILLLRKQNRHFDALREKILRGEKAVHLLPEEAIRLLQEFRTDLTGGATEFKNLVGKNQDDFRNLVDEANKSTSEARSQTEQTVATFKTKLNDMLTNMQKFMERVQQNSGESREQAVETKDYAKQTSALLSAKEEEIAALKGGFHVQLIAPLVKTFLAIRDELDALGRQSGDDTQKDLRAIDQKITSALAELQIEETKMPEDPDELPSRYWETLGAPEITNEPAKHGRLARVHSPGYRLHQTKGDPVLIRKAVVVVYSHDAAQAPQHPESRDAPQAIPEKSQTPPAPNPQQ